MRKCALLLAAASVALSGLWAGPAFAAKQLVAMFPLQNLSDNAIAGDVTRLGTSIKEKLRDRLDVELLAGGIPDDPPARRKKARGIGAAYILTGAVTRIGRSITLDLTIASTEEPAKGRTVVVSGTEDAKTAGGGLSPVFSRMATEAAAKLKYMFFGDETVVEGEGKRKIPKLSGTVSRSRNIPGDVVSIAWADTDRNGKTEVIAAYPDSIAVYNVDGDDLTEKRRIANAGNGIFYVDAADINRNGIAEIIATRYAAGKALSDVWEYDGREYQRVARDIPLFLRAMDFGSDGILLVAQESDPATIFNGPVFRLGLSRYGLAERKEKEVPLPLPGGTWIYSFATLKKGDGIRFAVLGERERLTLLGDNGAKLWEGIDAVSGTETALDAPLAPKRLYMPTRMFGVGLAGNKDDELLVMNNLVLAGGFFEGIRVFSNSEALCFAQNGDSLQLAWRTGQIGSSARDAFIDFSPRGKTLRVGVASKDKGKILGQFGEWRVLWLK